MLSLIEAELVDKKGWLTKSELGDIFAIAESTPGPISINTATFIGTKRLGIFGGIGATLGVILPSFIIISILSVILNLVKDNKWVGYLFRGIRVGVLVLIFKAALSFFTDMKKTLFSFILLAVSFILVFLVQTDVVYIMLGTILLCSAIVAAKSYINHKKYHTYGTPEYYSTLKGKPLEKEEYFAQTAVESGILSVKTLDNAVYVTRLDDISEGGTEDDAGCRASVSQKEVDHV